MNEDQLKACVAFALGEHCGLSASAILGAAVGVSPQYGFNYPSDLGDVRRCMMCCEATGISVEIMRGIGATWAEIVDVWPQIEDAFAAEYPHWNRGKWSVSTSAESTPKLHAAHFALKAAIERGRTTKEAR